MDGENHGESPIAKMNEHVQIPLLLGVFPLNFP